MDDIALGVSASAGTVAHGGNLTYTIAVTSKGPDFGYNVRISDPLPAGTTFVSYDAGGGTCTAPAVGGTGHAELRGAASGEGGYLHREVDRERERGGRDEAFEYGYECFEYAGLCSGEQYRNIDDDGELAS